MSGGLRHSQSPGGDRAVASSPAALGTGWGVLRGLLRTAGLSPKLATAGHSSAVWGGALVMLPSLDVAPRITLWGREEIAIDIWHHLVYALATAVSFELIDGRE